MIRFLIGLILLPLSFFLVLRKKEKFDKISETFSVDNLSLEDLIIWFKKNINKEDKILIPILIKKNKYESISGNKLKSDNNHNLILVQCFFNKDKEIIKEYRIIYCNKISSDLDKMFANKEMLIFS